MKKHILISLVLVLTSWNGAFAEIFDKGLNEYKNFYELLGVPENATEAVIKKAVVNGMARFHPDRNPGDIESEGKFKVINSIREYLLSNPTLRKIHDEYIEISKTHKQFIPMEMQMSIFENLKGRLRYGSVTIEDFRSIYIQEKENKIKQRQNKAAAQAKQEDERRREAERLEKVEKEREKLEKEELEKARQRAEAMAAEQKAEAARRAEAAAAKPDSRRNCLKSVSVLGPSLAVTAGLPVTYFAFFNDSFTPPAAIPKPKRLDETMQTLSSSNSKSLEKGSSKEFENPSKKDPVVPSKKDPVILPKAAPVVPPKVDPVVPPKADPVVPPKADPVVPPKADPVVPPKADPVVPPKADPVVPPKADPVVPPKADPVMPPKKDPAPVDAAGKIGKKFKDSLKGNK